MSAQCEILEAIPCMLVDNLNKATPAGVFTEEIFAKLMCDTDAIIFICHDNFIRNGQTFDNITNIAQLKGLR